MANAMEEPKIPIDLAIRAAIVNLTNGDEDGEVQRNTPDLQDIRMFVRSYLPCYRNTKVWVKCDSRYIWNMTNVDTLKMNTPVFIIKKIEDYRKEVTKFILENGVNDIGLANPNQWMQFFGLKVIGQSADEPKNKAHVEENQEVDDVSASDGAENPEDLPSDIAPEVIVIGRSSSPESRSSSPERRSSSPESIIILEPKDEDDDEDDEDEDEANDGDDNEDDNDRNVNNDKDEDNVEDDNDHNYGFECEGWPFDYERHGEDDAFNDDDLQDEKTQPLIQSSREQAASSMDHGCDDNSHSSSASGQKAGRGYSTMPKTDFNKLLHQVHMESKARMNNSVMGSNDQAGTSSRENQIDQINCDDNFDIDKVDAVIAKMLIQQESQAKNTMERNANIHETSNQKTNMSQGQVEEHDSDANGDQNGVQSSGKAEATETVANGSNGKKEEKALEKADEKLDTPKKKTEIVTNQRVSNANKTPNVQNDANQSDSEANDAPAQGSSKKRANGKKTPESRRASCEAESAKTMKMIAEVRAIIGEDTTSDDPTTVSGNQAPKKVEKQDQSMTPKSKKEAIKKNTSTKTSEATQNVQMESKSKVTKPKKEPKTRSKVTASANAKKTVPIPKSKTIIAKQPRTTKPPASRSRKPAQAKKPKEKKTTTAEAPNSSKKVTETSTQTKKMSGKQASKNVENESNTTTPKPKKELVKTKRAPSSNKAKKANIPKRSKNVITKQPRSTKTPASGNRKPAKAKESKNKMTVNAENSASATAEKAAPIPKTSKKVIARQPRTTKGPASRNTKTMKAKEPREEEVTEANDQGDTSARDRQQTSHSKQTKNSKPVMSCKSSSSLNKKTMAVRKPKAKKTANVNQEDKNGSFKSASESMNSSKAITTTKGKRHASIPPKSPGSTSRKNVAPKKPRAKKAADGKQANKNGSNTSSSIENTVKEIKDNNSSQNEKNKVSSQKKKRTVKKNNANDKNIGTNQTPATPRTRRA